MHSNISYESLLQANSSRTFLLEALKIQYAKVGKINLSHFSKASGFKSRSFLAEYLNSKKNLSKESLKNISSALKLPRNYIQLFKLYVYLEQQDLQDKHFDQDEIKVKINILKTNIKNLPTPINENPKSLGFLKDVDLLKVFAAMGSKDVGATATDIQQRTNLSIENIYIKIFSLEQLQVIHKVNNRYFVLHENITMLGIRSAQELSFLVKQISSDIYKNAEKICGRNDETLYLSTFSMSQKNMTRLKSRLNETIESVISEFQENDGDVVTQIFLCAKK